MKITRKLSLLTLVLLTMSTSAFAADAPAPATEANDPDTGSMFVSALGGYTYHRDTDIHHSAVDYGARLGVYAGKLGDFGKLAFGLTFDRFSFSPINNVTQAYNSLLVQALVRKFMGTGFYFGPQIGAYMGSVSVLGTMTTFNGFAVGAVGGYDYDFNSSWSAGLEFNYQSLNGGTANATKFDGTYALKSLVTASYHFNTDRTIATTPSSAEKSNAPETESNYFVGILGGASYAEANLQGASGDTKINYGARFGVNTFKLPSFGTIAFAVQADRFTPAFATGTTAYVHTFMAQALARRIGDSGYYLGLEGGLGMSHFSTPVGSSTFYALALGGLAGYDYYLAQNWSIAPEFRFDHYMQTHSGVAILSASSVYRYLANVSYHF